MGLAIPSLTAITSNRTPAEVQGRLMGGMQAILSLAMILGPVTAGLAFDRLASRALPHRRDTGPLRPDRLGSGPAFGTQDRGYTKGEDVGVGGGWTGVRT